MQQRVSSGLRRLSAFAAGMVVAVTSSFAITASAHAQARDTFDRPGNILIADQFNNRVVEVDPGHRVVWQFGDGSPVAGPHSVVGVNDAERVSDGLTLISGTGTPANTDPSCPVAQFPRGCPDNRVILMNQAGEIVWQYGQAGVTGSGPNELNTPVQSTALPNGDVLITDQGNERVIEVDRWGCIVWQYGQTGMAGSDPGQLNSPNSALLLQNGDILIADESNNRVIEVNRNHDIVWQYGSPSDTTTLNGAAFASRLDDGDTLITDSGNNRIVEVDADKNVVFTYATNARPGSTDMPLPTRAVRLANGDTLISDQFNDQVIEINPQGDIVFAQGRIQQDGRGFNRLNAPYDAKVIGDYTGLTDPGDFGKDVRAVKQRKSGAPRD